MVNVASGVWGNALSHPNRVALRADSKEWTFESLRAAAAHYGGALQATGIKQDDRVLLIAPSVPEFAVAYYGLQLVGATAITMNTMAAASEIDYVVDDSGAVMLVAWHESATAASKVAAARGLQIWLLKPGAAVIDATPVEAPMVLDPQSAAVILYTSGMTGRPKGAELTVANLLGCSDAFMEVLELDINDRFGTGLPLFHVFGQAVVMNTVLRLGASLSLLHPFDPNEMLAMMKEDELTAVAGVPTMWNAMLHGSGDYTANDFTALRMAMSGGASLPAEVVRAFSERFGCVILEGYGLTETTGAATFNGLNRETKIGSVGITLPGTQVEARDPHGTPVPSGEVGEIFVKGPTVMKGYWQRPEATEQDLQDGWLKTGDLGHLDDDGDVRIVDHVVATTCIRVKSRKSSTNIRRSLKWPSSASPMTTMAKR